MAPPPLPLRHQRYGASGTSLLEREGKDGGENFRDGFKTDRAEREGNRDFSGSNMRATAQQTSPIGGDGPGGDSNRRRLFGGPDKAEDP